MDVVVPRKQLPLPFWPNPPHTCTSTACTPIHTYLLHFPVQLCALPVHEAGYELRALTVCFLLICSPWALSREHLSCLVLCFQSPEVSGTQKVVNIHPGTRVTACHSQLVFGSPSFDDCRKELTEVQQDTQRKVGVQGTVTRDNHAGTALLNS